MIPDVNYDDFMGLLAFVVGDVTISSQAIKYNQYCSSWIRQSAYSIHIKLIYTSTTVVYMLSLFARQYLIHYSLTSFITYWESY
jgi:hypothetical protein